MTEPPFRPEQRCAHCDQPIDNLRGYWRHTDTRNPYCWGPPNLTAVPS